MRDLLYARVFIILSLTSRNHWYDKMSSCLVHIIKMHFMPNTHDNSPSTSEPNLLSRNPGLAQARQVKILTWIIPATTGALESQTSFPPPDTPSHISVSST
ncbi:hypothetical protein BDV41DRAFT_21826 [Aspergillus transmontanensis]|uniref:Uncharacterized protein n=1 Tax=Aspergillus transmontanensis TaxID=1034304 RepID=A0A5N6WCS5_9EURO|nr:hypothetical protein BDV41DRAFT_21826 [Aspergillus transmontanensis]